MSRTGYAALAVLIVVHLAAVFAGFLSPNDPARQHRNAPLAPPTRLHFIDGDGNLHLRPFVYPLHMSAGGPYEEDRSRRFPVRFLVEAERYSIVGSWSASVRLFGVEEPAAIFLMGTDDLGRDQFSRFLHGARISLFAGPMAALLALLIGFVVGAAAGFFGSWVDELLMAAAELFLALPWLYLLLGVRAALPLDLSPAVTLYVVVALLGVLGWARPARIFRSIVMRAKQRDFVTAARGFGASELYLIRRHIAPQVRGAMAAQAVLLIPQYILAEVTMSFLGLGIGEPVASWGALLSRLQQYDAFVSQWWVWIPGLLLLPVFGAYYALGAALDGNHSPDRSKYIENTPRKIG